MIIFSHTTHTTLATQKFDCWQGVINYFNHIVNLVINRKNPFVFRQGGLGRLLLFSLTTVTLTTIATITFHNDFSSLFIYQYKEYQRSYSVSGYY